MQATPTIQVDDDRVRITQWHFPPSAETGFHVHEMAYVVVPMTTGALTITNADGVETVSDLTAGIAYSRPDGVAHNVVNSNPFPFTFVEIEMKSSPLSTGASK